MFVAGIEGVAVGCPGGVTGVVGDPSVGRELDAAEDDPDGDGLTESEGCTNNRVDPGVLLMTGDAEGNAVVKANPVEDGVTEFVDTCVSLMPGDAEGNAVVKANLVEGGMTKFVDTCVSLMPGDAKENAVVKANPVKEGLTESVDTCVSLLT